MGRLAERWYARKQRPQRSPPILEWVRAIFAVAGPVSALALKAGALRKRLWSEVLSAATAFFSYAAGVCAGAVGVTLAAGAEGSAVSSICTGVMISPPRTTKFSASGKR